MPSCGMALYVEETKPSLRGSGREERGRDRVGRKGGGDNVIQYCRPQIGCQGGGWVRWESQ